MSLNTATTTSTAPARQAQAPQAPRREEPAGAAPLKPPARADGQDRLGRVLARSVLQRMTLAQAGWLPGLEDIGERTLVTDNRTVRIYFEQAAQAPTKAAALATAGRLNAAVGKTVDDQAYATWNVEKRWGPRTSWNSNDKWTPKGAELGKADLKSLDPFYYGLKVPFKAGDTDHVLELTFQHAKDWTGYVESVYDSSNVHTGSVPTMYDIGSEVGLKGTKPAGAHYRNLQFSNTHEPALKTNLLTDTSGGTHDSFDAYTKIAGEGARWQCVRAHGTRLQNDSFFVVRHTDRTMRGVTFKRLWANWRDVFGKAYDIDDAAVSAAIKAALAAGRNAPVARGQFARSEVKLVNAAVAKDYDLDNHRSF